MLCSSNIPDVNYESKPEEIILQIADLLVKRLLHLSSSERIQYFAPPAVQKSELFCHNIDNTLLATLSHEAVQAVIKKGL